MYDLQPAAAALHQGSLNAFTNIAGLLLDSSRRTLDICSAARRDLLDALNEAAQVDGLPRLDAEKAGSTLHRHSLALTQESLEALVSLQEEVIRFFEGHSHGLSAFIAHTIEKAGQASPAEILPAMNLFRKSVANLDTTLVNLAESAVQAAGQIEEKLVEEVAAAPAITASATAKAARSTPRTAPTRRKGA